MLSALIISPSTFLASLNAISDLPEPVGPAIRIIFCIGKKLFNFYTNKFTLVVAIKNCQ